MTRWTGRRIGVGAAAWGVVGVLAAAACGDAGGGGATDAGTGDPDAARTDGGADLDGGAPRADAGGPDAGPPLDPGPRFVGRHEEATDGTVRFGWPGTGLVATFRGTGLQVRMDDPARYFAVVVDGEPQPDPLATSSGEQTYDVVAGLPDGEHTVELYRRTEGSFGPTEVLDVTTDGELLGVPPPERRIEIIGDSISCGYGVEGADQYCDFSAETESQQKTYGAIAGRVLDAEVSTIAWSGKGLVANYGDDTFEPMPELYDRTIPTESPSWPFDVQVDAVVINLGTNDFSTDGDPSEAEFVSAYVDFLAHLRTVYPDAMILCTVAPALLADDEARAVAYIQSAVETRTLAGDDRVRWIDLRVDAIGFGCDWHPSVATQQAMADLLVAALRDALGW